MSDKDFKKLMELAKQKMEEAKSVTKQEAIDSLNKAGILTKKGSFAKNYKGLDSLKAS